MSRGRLGVAAIVTFGALVAGCGGGGGSSGGAATAGQGSVAVSIKDAPSDHITRCEVDITSVNLVRDDGLLVAVLPGRTRVDLAQLVTVSQLLTVSAVPGGTYTSTRITFDMSTAAVTIDGNAAQAALVDAAGAPLNGLVTRDIDMKGDPVRCEPALTRYIEIDFDLDASCVIDAANNRVTLGPVLRASTEPARPVQTRLHGILADQAQLTLELRPPGAPGTGPRVRVTTSANTSFLLNGKPSTREQVLALPLGAPVMAQGQLSAGRDALVADRVESNDPLDVVDGLVTRRTVDGVLTVSARCIDFPAGTLRTGTFTVDARRARINASPAPPPPGSTAPVAPITSLSHDAIAVGQRIDARGELAGDALDASKGFVMLVPTPVAGVARGAASGGLLTMRVDAFAGRPPAELDFRVGNVASADPALFVVDASTLDVATVVSGTPIAVNGVLAAWSAASSAPDMKAHSVADRRNLGAVLQCDWSTPTGAPFTRLSGGGFTLDLSASNRRHVDQGQPQPTSLASTDRPEAVPGGGSEPAKFTIVQQGQVTEHGSMANFAADCQARLGAGGRARAVAAMGQWDPATRRLAARHVTVTLE